MKKRENAFTCAQAKAMDLVDYLKVTGHEPQKIRNYDYWYLSPLRIEKTASFKVNRKLNRWYDHGLGMGGNIIDFGILYHKCTVTEFLQSLNDNFSFHRQAHFLPDTNNRVTDTSIKIIDTKPLHSLSLIYYLHSRNIPILLADQYCHEVMFELSRKIYYSIGFLNDAGGYELRNPRFKNSSSPKCFTTIKNKAEKIAVFEGFFDFLSFLVLLPNHETFTWDFCILNSLSFFEKSIPLFRQYQSVHLFLDNDKAGQNCSRLGLTMGKQIIDESSLYKNYKDLNEWITGMGKLPLNQVLRSPQ